VQCFAKAPGGHEGRGKDVAHCTADSRNTEQLQYVKDTCAKSSGQRPCCCALVMQGRGLECSPFYCRKVTASVEQQQDVMDSDLYHHSAGCLQCHHTAKCKQQHQTSTTHNQCDHMTKQSTTGEKQE
jgi:hypothetical protein